MQIEATIMRMETIIQGVFLELFETETALSLTISLDVKSRVGFSVVINGDDAGVAAVVVNDGVMVLVLVKVIVLVLVLVVVVVVVVGVVGSMLGSMHFPFTRVRPVRHVSHVSPVEQVVHVREHSKHLLSLPYLPRGHFE